MLEMEVVLPPGVQKWNSCDKHARRVLYHNWDGRVPTVILHWYSIALLSLGDQGTSPRC